MYSEIATRTGTNLLRVGTTLLLSTIVSTAMKDVSNDALSTLAKDIRRIKTDFNERRLQNEA
ncbi:hypothetical protein [Dethiobacter alkaliphilus]|uniref:Uncharacterized protein n=1 Tax=Dethiobacter alkaliphilus AHT 1 TaxID=555088 RepID=C0GE78_DETAL|nr:hypothetical protein [Dethiobacter alkaliphilus]EEG78372.1 hypothetical protein DealDRAFT_0787 [Dethiobacter alkaliphilus AHT 1]